jgi:hypothetical protein
MGVEVFSGVEVCEQVGERFQHRDLLVRSRHLISLARMYPPKPASQSRQWSETTYAVSSLVFSSHFISW